MAPSNHKLMAKALILVSALFFLAHASDADKSLKGRLIANHIGKVSSEITGERTVRIQKLLVREGDRVKKGELLAQLSTEQLIADRSVAMSSLQAAEAMVGVAKSNLAGAKMRYDRQAGLENSAAFRRAAFEDAQVSLQTAESQLRRAENVVSVRKAEVERIELEIRLADILAPYDGIVMDVLTSVGAAVTQTKPDILMLLDLSRVEIELPISLARASEFQPGRSLVTLSAMGLSTRLKLERSCLNLIPVKTHA